MSPVEAENMAKATRMRNAELASALRTIARIQDDDALAKWVLDVAAERLEAKHRPAESMSFAAYMAYNKRILTQNAAPASRELAPLDCKRPDQPGQVQLSSPNTKVSHGGCQKTL